MDHNINKKKYFNLCHIYGGTGKQLTSHPYRMDARGITYKIYVTCPNDTYYLLNVHQPVIPGILEKQKLLFNMTDIKYKGIIQYTTGLEYEQYECNLSNVVFPYSVKKIDEIKFEPWSESRQLPIDRALINFFMKINPNNNIRLKRDSKELLLQPSDNVYTEYAILPHNIRFTDTVEGQIKYFIPLFDTDIKTIYDFTRELHLQMLINLRDGVIKWIHSKHPDININNLRIYTLFPNQHYLHPYFLADYHDDSGETFERIIDVDRRVSLDYIIEILQIVGNMKKCIFMYYAPCDSLLYRAARTQIIYSLYFFEHVYTHVLADSKNPETDIKNYINRMTDAKLRIEHNGINFLLKKKRCHDDIKHCIQFCKNKLIEPSTQKYIKVLQNILNIVENINNYEKLYYMQKYLIGNPVFYSFLTYYKNILTNQCTDKMQQILNKCNTATTNFIAANMSTPQNLTYDGNDGKHNTLNEENKSKFKIIRMFHDFTR